LEKRYETSVCQFAKGGGMNEEGEGRRKREGYRSAMETRQTEGGDVEGTLMSPKRIGSLVQSSNHCFEKRNREEDDKVENKTQS